MTAELSEPPEKPTAKAQLEDCWARLQFATSLRDNTRKAADRVFWTRECRRLIDVWLDACEAFCAANLPEWKPA